MENGNNIFENSSKSITVSMDASTVRRKPIRPKKRNIKKESKLNNRKKSTVTDTKIIEIRKKLDLREKDLLAKENMLKEKLFILDKSKIQNVENKKSDQKEVMEIEQRVAFLTKEFELYRSKNTSILTKILRENSNLKRIIEKNNITSDNHNIGYIKLIRNGHIIDEKFIYGNEYEHLKSKKNKVTSEINRLMDIKKKLNLKKKLCFYMNNFTKAKENVSKSQFNEFYQTDEILKHAISRAKKECILIESDEKNIKLRAQNHITRTKRFADEENSNFKDLPVLKDRYLLLRLSGKGGFSEVWKAYDLIDHKHVACKIHQLNLNWSEDRKKNYIRHATREYEIHRSMTHPTIVPLYDVFGINLNSFCTVLQFCEGSDLDNLLKKAGHLNEKDAKIILLQIFQGLKYLSQKTGVIHYDLKPANILFHNGVAQITDFGLSKKLERNSSVLELTSQGAGTYWYLPPEAFDTTTEGPAIISSKVDVWSAGVIFYQMLFGVRPFGHKMTQELIMQQGTLHRSNLKPITFPTYPKVSQQAKNLICFCLTVKQSERPDADSVLKHAYFDNFRNK